SAWGIMNYETGRLPGEIPSGRRWRLIYSGLVANANQVETRCRSDKTGRYPRRPFQSQFYRLEALFPERGAGHRAYHQSHHLVEKSVRRKFHLEQIAPASDPDVLHRPHGTSFFFSAICGKGGEIMPANEEFGRSSKHLPIKRRGDMPCPADLKRRSDRAIYDPVTVNF